MPPFHSERMVARCFLLMLLLTAACKGPGHVEFSQGKCFINGTAANVDEVESQQAIISERIISRQPMFVLVTVLIVLLAGASHLEKVVLLFSTRGEHAHGLSERLRLALDRYRDRPLRYFSIVVSTLLLALREVEWVEKAQKQAKEAGFCGI